MVGREVNIDILKKISVDMDGPRVDIQDGMLNASKATSGALPYMQLLVSW